MWVRVATFEGVDPEKANAILKERMASGEMTPAAGMNSVLILDDKDAKKRKFFAFFESKDAITAAEADSSSRVRRFRSRSAASGRASLLRGRNPRR